MIRSNTLLLALACATASISVLAADPVFADQFESAVVAPSEPVGLTGITAAHNVVRASVGVPALVWDAQLAASAAAWGAQCVDTQAPSGLIDHNPNRSSGFPWYVGENIYGTSGLATPQDAVNVWAAEGAYYNYASNTCAAGQICGHYTQLVWRTTQKIGCAISTCPALVYRSAIVCDYGPGGNTGGRPY